MSKKIDTPIYDFYQSLDGESRGTKSKFLIWLSSKTGLSANGVFARLKAEKWSPIERNYILQAIEDDSWR